MSQEANEHQRKEQQEQITSKLILVLSWLWGGFLAFLAIIFLFTDLLASLIFLLMSAVILPPVNKWIFKRWNYRIPIYIKATVLIIGYIAIASYKSYIPVGTSSIQAPVGRGPSPEVEKSSPKPKPATTPPVERQEPIQKPQEKPEPVERQPSLEERAWDVIRNVRDLGGWYLEGKVRDIEVTPIKDSRKKAVNITFDAAQRSTSKNTLDGAVSDVYTLGQAFKAADLQEMGSLRIVVLADFRDKYGQVEESGLVIALFSNQTLQKIQFQNLAPAELIKAADLYWINPVALQE